MGVHTADYTCWIRNSSALNIMHVWTRLSVWCNGLFLTYSYTYRHVCMRSCDHTYISLYLSLCIWYISFYSSFAHTLHVSINGYWCCVFRMIFTQSVSKAGELVHHFHVPSRDIASWSNVSTMCWIHELWGATLLTGKVHTGVAFSRVASRQWDKKLDEVLVDTVLTVLFCIRQFVCYYLELRDRKEYTKE